MDKKISVLLNYFCLVCFVFLSKPSYSQDNLIKQVEGNGTNSKSNYQFTKIFDLENTPVKNQAKSGTCWSYGIVALMENEMLKNGSKQVDLSEMFIVRNTYIEKANKYVRFNGKNSFSQGGANTDMLSILKKYGIVPQNVYQGLNYGFDINNHSELEVCLKGILDGVISNKGGKLSTAWRRGYIAFLDEYLGKEPNNFDYEGKKYTPKEFAEKIAKFDPNNYIQLTSFTNYDMWDYCQLEVEDNWSRASSFNVPLEDMMKCIDNALEKGYSLLIAADVSEKGFGLKSGLMILPEKNFEDISANELDSLFANPHKQRDVSQESRQEAFDNYTTSDDHSMLMTGMAKDQNGTKYYIIKNSWGEKDNPYRKGFFYASESYIKYKTLSILLNKGGLTKDVLKKLK